MMASGAKERRERYSNEMRQEILRAAREIIAAEGAGALSIRGIASRIGYSAAALYEYFDGKRAIAAALFTSGFAQLAEMMEYVERMELEPLQRIRVMGRDYRRFALAHPQEYSLMFGRPIPEFTPGEAESAVSTRAFGPLQRAFAEGVALGALRPMDPRTGATIAWALVHGLVSLELAGMGGPPSDAALPPDCIAPSDIATIYDDALDALNISIRAPS